MDKPTIIINGKVVEMRQLKGRDWRIFGAFLEDRNDLMTPEYVEKYVNFISNFFDGVTAEELLDLPLEEILPVYISIRKYFVGNILSKIEQIEKNSEEVKVEQ